MQTAKEIAGIPSESSVQLVFYPKAKGMIEALLERLQSRVGTPITLPKALRPWQLALMSLTAIDQAPLVIMPFLMHMQ